MSNITEKCSMKFKYIKLKQEKISNTLYENNIAKIDSYILNCENLYDIQNQYMY